jgi:thiol-disulfide isomerase/thioredoxin
MNHSLLYTFRDGRRFAATLLATLALGFGWAWLSRAPAAATTGGAPPPSPREGFSAPDFALDGLGGQQVRLADLRGQVVVVNLWASWCLPCRAEMPALERAYQAYRDAGLVVLAVNATDQDDERLAAEFAGELGLTFPILLDRAGEASARYRLQALPSTYFIDRQGIIRSVVIGGPMSEALIRSKVEDLLE